MVPPTPDHPRHHLLGFRVLLPPIPLSRGSFFPLRVGRASHNGFGVPGPRSPRDWDSGRRLARVATFFAFFRLRPGARFLPRGAWFLRPGARFLRPGARFSRPGAWFSRPGASFFQPGARFSGGPRMYKPEVRVSGDFPPRGKDIRRTFGFNPTWGVRRLFRPGV